MQFGVRIVRNGIFTERKMERGWRIALTHTHRLKKLVILSSWPQETIWISKVIISIQMTIQCLKKIKKMSGGM